MERSQDEGGEGAIMNMISYPQKHIEDPPRLRTRDADCHMLSDVTTSSDRHMTCHGCMWLSSIGEQKIWKEV